MSLFYPIIAFAATALSLWAGRTIALKAGFADQPGGRKKHDDPVPPIGGLVILPVFLLVCHFAGLKEIVPLPLAIGVGAILAMGAIDDAFTVKPFVKLAIMILTAAYVVIFGNAQIGWLGDLFGFGDVEVGFLSKGFTIMAIVLLMNAVNMADGVDGLASGLCAQVAFWMLAMCAGVGAWEPFWALAILTGALGGFLALNMRAPWRKRASVFLGDAGTLSLGLILGWFCIKLTQGTGAFIAPATVIWFIALPVMDAFALFIARSARGLHPFNADRRHLHHRFLDAGVAPGRTTVLILAMAAFLSLLAYAAQAVGVPAWVLFYSWLALFGAHTFAIMHPKGYTLWSRVLRTRGRTNA